MPEMPENEQAENQAGEAENQEEITIIINPDAPGSGNVDEPEPTFAEEIVESLGEPDNDDNVDYPVFTPQRPNPLQKLWIGKCTIYEYQTVTDPATHQSVQNLVAVLENEPCRLSYKYKQSTDLQSGAAVMSQSVTLFIRPDLAINPGSVIEVAQQGRTTRFKGTGKASVYTNHQELIMDLYEDKV